MDIKLGTARQIVIGSKVYDDSLEFLEKLELDKLEEGKSPWNTRFTLFTDGRQNILLEESNNKENYSGLIYYNENLEDLIIKLEKHNIKIIEKRDGDRLFSVMFVSNEGIAVKIINAPHKGSPQRKHTKSRKRMPWMQQLRVQMDRYSISSQEMFEKRDITVLSHKIHKIIG